MELPH
jgi:hypothetical protein